jgi:regulatory protein
MKITDIRPQKRLRNRLSVYVDGSYRFSLDADTLLRAAVHVGDEIDERDIERLTLKDEFARARDYGYLLLSYRDRSEREFRGRLLDRGFHEPIVEEVLANFRRDGLVSDERFTRAWIEHTVSGRPMGKMRIVHELKKKMVRDDAIDGVVEGLFVDGFEEGLARQAAEKRIRALEKYPDDVARRRLYRFLQGRGFHFTVIHDLMKEFFGDRLP